MCVRYLNLALVTPAVQMYMQEQSTTTLLLQGGGVFAGLVLLKVFIGVGLVFYAAGAHKRDAAVFLRSPAAAKPSDRISSGSGTGTFHSAAPPTPQPQQQEQQHQQQAGGDKAVPPSASVTPQSTPRVAVPGVGQHPPPGSFRAPPSAGIAGLVRQQQAGEAFAASPSSTPTALSSVSVGSQVPPHAGHASQGSPGRPRGHSITNPFAEARVTGDEVRMAVLVSGIEGATEFVAAQLEQQQQYVGLDTNIIPNITDQNSAESQSSNSSNNNSNNNSNYSSSERGVVGAGEWVPGATLEGRSSPPNSPQRQRGTVTPTQSQATVSRNRPPLGKLNTHGGKAERASSFTEGLATPPKCMSPPSRPPAPHSFAASSSSELAAAATPLSSEAHTHADSTQTSHLSHSHTSTPVVHLDAHAFTHAQAQSTTSSLHPQQVPGSINISNSRFIDVPDGTSEQSDLEETRSNFSDAPRMAALEDQDAARLRERLEFMEELSSIERYTVYKGRII